MRIELGIGGAFSKELRLSRGQLECFAALVAGDLQGLMAVDLRGKSSRAGKAIIVDYLATNPGNRMPAKGTKFVGIGLIAVAIAQSIERGWGGRIWLESLPGGASFYESLGASQAAPPVGRRKPGLHA